MIRLLVITRENEADKSYGLGKTLLPFVKEMRARGHEVIYFAKSSCSATHARWLPIFARFLRFFLKLAAPAVAERLVQGIAGARHAVRIKPSHVWIHDPWMALGYRLGLWSLFCFGNPAKVYISEHGLGSFTWAVSQDGLILSARTFRVMLALERWALSRADRVLLPSVTSMNALLRDFSYISVPTNFVVLSYGAPDGCTAESSVGDFSLFGFDAPPDVPVILAVGRISPAKNYRLLIDAVARIDKAVESGVQLLIAGGGDVQPLHEYADQQQLKHSLRTAFVADMNKVYSLADVYVSSCGIESFGQANREAMSFGLPCIVPSSGGSGEVLGCGAWIVPGTSDALASAITRVLKSSAIAAFWKEQALVEAAKFTPWPVVLDSFEQLLIDDFS